MPFSSAARFMQASGVQGQELVIPVVRSDYGNLGHSLSEVRQRYRQVRCPDLRRSSAELKVANAQSIAFAASRVASGHAVTIFPTGDLIDPITSAWQNGLGRIVVGLPEEVHESTSVSVVEPTQFSKGKLLSALLLRDMGIRPKRQTVSFRASTMGRVSSVFSDELFAGRPHAAQQIVSKVKDHYQATFRSNG